MTINRRRIQHVDPNERVDAGITSRPTRQLEEGLNALQDQVALMADGEALILRDVTLHSSTVVGTPTYWEAAQVRMSPAFPAVSYDPDSGSINTQASARVRGIVFRKESSTLGDVLIYGRVQLDISSVVLGTGGAGLYYLHPTVAGKLTKTRPVLAVPVLEVLGDGKVFVNPVIKSWVDEHVHSVRSLVCRPAGDHTPPGGGGTHTVTGADVSLPGWLPANHASFSGNAPAGAKFGYNLAADAETLALWPPTPVDAVCLIWDKGLNRVGGTELPLGTGGAVIVDTNGIWWMSNCNADVPWPNETFVDGVSTATPSGDACPRPETMRLRLYMNRATLSGDRTIVTSLTTAPNSVLTITDCYGNAATRGDLVIAADLRLLESTETDEAGYIVHKRIGDDGKVRRGPVVEGFNIVGGNFEVDGEYDEERDVYQGLVTITFTADPAAKELRPILTALTQAKQRSTDNRGSVIAFEKGYPASIVCMFHVPAAGLSAATPMRVRTTLIGTAAGQLPGLTVSYRIIPRGTTTPATLPSSSTTLSLGTMPTLTVADQFVELQTGTFNVDPGDHVILKVQRAHDDSYNGEVQILDILLA